MSKKIKVLLLEDVTGLGSAGDIVSASEGYARNFLFPGGKAALADEGATAKAKQANEQDQQKAQQQLTELREQAEALEKTELTITARVKEGEGEELYAPISTKIIADELVSQAKLKLKAKDISLVKPITSLGTYSITIRLAPDVEAVIKVTVTPNPDES